MPSVLTADCVVQCGHGGQVDVMGSPKLRVAATAIGSPAGVLLNAGIAGRSLKPVPLCATLPPPATNVPCTMVASPVPGTPPLMPVAFAKKLTVGGEFVVLDTLKGSTNGKVLGAPQLLLTAVPAQTKLTTI
jgi:hypothetical protein